MSQTITINRPNAIYATQPAPHVSNRYRFVSTRDAIDALMAQGFSAPIATPTRSQYGVHVLRFNHPDLHEVNIAGSRVRPQVILRNSHDTSAAFGLIAGAFRAACFNGLILGHGFAVRLVHTGAIQQDIKEALPNVFNTVQRGIETMGQWSQLILTDSDQVQLVNRSILLRLDESKIGQLNMESILKPRRIEDQGNDLFTIYNRLQERLINGKFEYIDANGKYHTVRKLYGARAVLSLNQKLANNTSEFYNQLTKAV